MNQTNLNNIWNEVLKKLEKELDPIYIDLYFKDTKLISLDDDTAQVLVQSEIYKKNMERQYNNIIEEKFTEVTSSNFKIKFVTEMEINNNIEIDTNTFGVPDDALFQTNLLPEYTFENFVTGNSKTARFAKGVALSVAQQPGKLYNPLYIYGKSGLGKTHLMQAIGNYIVENSNKKVLYVTSETFVNDFMELYRTKNEHNDFNDNIASFKKKYRDLDVLIIDDIQYLEAAGKTQQEFFNTFNELHNNNKQIILASDRSPDDLKKLEDRLRTRFSWGMILNVYPPDFDLRVEIITRKLENYNFVDEFPKEVKEYIANNFTSDVRNLEGAIKRVVAFATMMGPEITYDLAIEALKDMLPSNIVSKNKIEFLQQLICSKYNISMDDLLSKKRNKEIAVPRQIAMYISKNYIHESFPKIGIAFGGKDHTTVMHSYRKIEKEIKENKNYKLQEEINKIVEQLNV